jgi:cleavage and polyadenylation specificity factor subunit 3
MGTLAEREAEPKEGEVVHGILVTHNNFHSKIVRPEDLATYTPLRVGSISSKLHVPYVASIPALKLFLTEMFVGVSEESNDEGATKFGLHENQVSTHLYNCARGV